MKVEDAKGKGGFVACFEPPSQAQSSRPLAWPFRDARSVLAARHHTQETPLCAGGFSQSGRRDLSSGLLVPQTVPASWRVMGRSGACALFGPAHLITADPRARDRESRSTLRNLLEDSGKDCARGL